jgi:hypothetical protein
MRREVTIAEVRSPTQRGSIRWVVRDTDGNEYTTFREAIGERLKICRRTDGAAGLSAGDASRRG